MRLKLDENVHPAAAELLAAGGHDVHTIHTEGLRGCDDSTLLDRCRGENRALVTFDLDFGDVRAYPPAHHAGIIVLRVRSQSRRHVLAVLSRIHDLLTREPVTARLWIVSERGVRIRE